MSLSGISTTLPPSLSTKDPALCLLPPAALSLESLLEKTHTLPAPPPSFWTKKNVSSLLAQCSISATVAALATLVWHSFPKTTPTDPLQDPEEISETIPLPSHTDDLQTSDSPTLFDQVCSPTTIVVLSCLAALFSLGSKKPPAPSSPAVPIYKKINTGAGSFRINIASSASQTQSCLAPVSTTLRSAKFTLFSESRSNSAPATTSVPISTAASSMAPPKNPLRKEPDSALRVSFASSSKNTQPASSSQISAAQSERFMEKIMHQVLRVFGKQQPNDSNTLNGIPPSSAISSATSTAPEQERIGKNRRKRMLRKGLLGHSSAQTGTTLSSTASLPKLTKNQKKRLRKQEKRQALITESASTLQTVSSSQISTVKPEHVIEKIRHRVLQFFGKQPPSDSTTLNGIPPSSTILPQTPKLPSRKVRFLLSDPKGKERSQMSAGSASEPFEEWFKKKKALLPGKPILKTGKLFSPTPRVEQPASSASNTSAEQDPCQFTFISQEDASHLLFNHYYSCLCSQASQWETFVHRTARRRSCLQPFFKNLAACVKGSMPEDLFLELFQKNSYKQLIAAIQKLKQPLQSRKKKDLFPRRKMENHLQRICHLFNTYEYKQPSFNPDYSKSFGSTLAPYPMVVKQLCSQLFSIPSLSNHPFLTDVSNLNRHTASDTVLALNKTIPTDFFQQNGFLPELRSTYKMKTDWEMMDAEEGRLREDRVEVHCVSLPATPLPQPLFQGLIEESRRKHFLFVKHDPRPFDLELDDLDTNVQVLSLPLNTHVANEILRSRHLIESLIQPLVESEKGFSFPAKHEHHSKAKLIEQFTTLAIKINSLYFNNTAFTDQLSTLAFLTIFYSYIKEYVCGISRVQMILTRTEHPFSMEGAAASIDEVLRNFRLKQDNNPETLKELLQHAPYDPDNQPSLAIDVYAKVLQVLSNIDEERRRFIQEDFQILNNYSLISQKFPRFEEAAAEPKTRSRHRSSRSSRVEEEETASQKSKSSSKASTEYVPFEKTHLMEKIVADFCTNDTLDMDKVESGLKKAQSKGSDCRITLNDSRDFSVKDTLEDIKDADLQQSFKVFACCLQRTAASRCRMWAQQHMRELKNQTLQNSSSTPIQIKGTFDRKTGAWTVHIDRTFRTEDSSSKKVLTMIIDSERGITGHVR